MIQSLVMKDTTQMLGRERVVASTPSPDALAPVARRLYELELRTIWNVLRYRGCFTEEQVLLDRRMY